MLCSSSQHRVACAAMIEQRIKALAYEKGMPSCTCAWNLGQGWENSGPHRLDVGIRDGTVKIYFTDVELVAFGDLDVQEQTERRLRSLMNELDDERPLSLSVLAIKRLGKGLRP